MAIIEKQNKNTDFFMIISWLRRFELPEKNMVEASLNTS